MSRCKCIILLAVLGWLASVVGAPQRVLAKVYLDVYGQSYKKITIAVPPFASEDLGTVPFEALLTPYAGGPPKGQTAAVG